MNNMREIFILVCTEGMTVLKAKDIMAVEFTEFLADQLKDIGFVYVESHYDYTSPFSDRTIIVENNYGPLLKIIIDDEHMSFNVLDEISREEDMKLAGEIVMKCVGIVSAWNIRIDALYSSKKIKIKSFAAYNKKYNSIEMADIYKNLPSSSYNKIPKIEAGGVSKNDFEYI